MSQKISESEFETRWSALHGNVNVEGIVKIWLRIAFRISTLLNVLMISPNVLTGLGILFAAATAVASPSLFSALFLALSLCLDGVDGSLAIVSGKDTKLGALFDAVADRVSEALWAIAFYRLGAPMSVVLLLWLVAAIQEYARARIGSAGVRDVGVVTPAERPVRASFLFIGVILFHLDVSQSWTTGIALTLLVVQIVSIVLVLRFAYKSLR